MRSFHSTKIAILMIAFAVLLAMDISAIKPAFAQYYLVESKHEASASTYQNFDYDYLSGVETAADASPVSESDGCINGIVSMFFSIAGICIGLPLLIMFLLNGVIGNSIGSRRAAEFYLDAPQQPLRWHDPERKSLAETVGK